MKKFLIIGLIISIISILFNVFVYTYFSDEIIEKEEEISFLRSRNLVLSNEFSDAEHFIFFSDYYSIETKKVFTEINNYDSSEIKYLTTQRDLFLIKSLNYSYNSTVLNPLSDKDSTKEFEIKKYIDVFNSNQKSQNIFGLSNKQRASIKNLFTGYYQNHENLIINNNKQIDYLLDDLSDLGRNYEISKGIAVSLQVIGLVLIFLKDIRE